MPVRLVQWLPSDWVKSRVGRDKRHDPKQLSRRRVGDDECRLAVVMNTYYPEVQGGYYFNRHILSSLQQCFLDIGLLFVLEETFPTEPSTLAPWEPCGSLEVNEKYVLVDRDGQPAASAVLWRYGIAGGGPFFGDNVVLDTVVGRDIAKRLLHDIEAACSVVGVSYEYCGETGE